MLEVKVKKLRWSELGLRLTYSGQRYINLFFVYFLSFILQVISLKLN